MVRRFRDDTKRVKYAGPLMACWKLRNLKALEAQLVRVLTKAERKGTTLERSFRALRSRSVRHHFIG